MSRGVDELLAPLSLDTSTILHCGRQLQPNNYSVHGTVIESVDTFTDLGVIRSSNGSHAAHYTGLIAKARKVVGFICRSFQSKKKQFM